MSSPAHHITQPQPACAPPCLPGCLLAEAMAEGLGATDLHRALRGSLLQPPPAEEAVQEKRLLLRGALKSAWSQEALRCAVLLPVLLACTGCGAAGAAGAAQQLPAGRAAPPPSPSPTPACVLAPAGAVWRLPRLVTWRGQRAATLRRSSWMRAMLMPLWLGARRPPTSGSGNEHQVGRWGTAGCCVLLLAAPAMHLCAS